MADPSSTHQVSVGWVVDKRPGHGDPGHEGVSEIANNSDDEANSSLRSYNYQATDSSVQVSGRISGSNNWGSGARFERTYRVFTRSEQPIDSDVEPSVITPFLITGRGLCLRYRSTDDCPEVLPLQEGPGDILPGDWVIDEGSVQVANLTSRNAPGQRLPAVKETLRQIQFAMARSARMPSRRPFGQVSFLESNYFARKIADHIAPEVAQKPLARVGPQGDESAQGNVLTVHDVLTNDLMTLQRRTGLAVDELVRLRRAAIGRLVRDSERNGAVSRKVADDVDANPPDQSRTGPGGSRPDL
jgi:hypothetical protein